MKKKRKRNLNLISYRQLCRMIAMNQELPLQIVYDVLDSLCEAVYYIASEGYKVNVKRMGYFYGKKQKGYKKGDEVLIKFETEQNLPKDTCYEKGFEIIEKDGKYYKKYFRDTPDYYIPAFKTHRVYKEECKERSMEIWEQQQKNQ